MSRKHLATLLVVVVATCMCVVAVEAISCESFNSLFDTCSVKKPCANGCLMCGNNKKCECWQVLVTTDIMLLPLMLQDFDHAVRSPKTTHAAAGCIPEGVSTGTDCRLSPVKGSSSACCPGSACKLVKNAAPNTWRCINSQAP